MLYSIKHVCLSWQKSLNYNISPKMAGIDYPKPELRFVAACDVLGFKNKLYGQPLDDLSRAYSIFSHSISRVFDGHNNPLKAAPVADSEMVSHAIFSDTCFVWSQPLCGLDSLVDISAVSVFFEVLKFLTIYGIAQDMPLRLGVAYGEVCISKRDAIYVGKPISEAYLLENSQKWVGGTCDQSCKESPLFSRVIEQWRDVVEYQVPFEFSHKSAFALNWPQLATDDTVTRLEQMRESSPGESAKKKYSEAINFYHAVKHE
jgi:hypothetical protein